MPLEIARNDIANMQVDAVVNTANPKPGVVHGVDRGIQYASWLCHRQKLEVPH